MPDNSQNRPPGWQPKKPTEVAKSELGGNARTSVRLRVEDFENLIRDQGVRVNVYRTVLCPNLKSIDGGEHNIDCTNCRNGFIDLIPLCTMAFIQQQALDKEHFVEGDYDNTKVAATFLIGIELQYFTLVELCDHTDIFYEVIKRQTGNVDVLKYPAKKVNIAVDTNQKQYYCGIDFEIDMNGNLKWKANRGPDAGSLYSLHYEHNIQFRAVRAMHVNRFAQQDAADKVRMVKMQEQWLLAREYHTVPLDKNGNAIAPNRISEDDEFDDD